MSMLIDFLCMELRVKHLWKWLNTAENWAIFLFYVGKAEIWYQVPQQVTMNEIQLA
jgi:hypothetical protein